MRDKLFEDASLYRDEILNDKVSKNTYNKRITRAKVEDNIKFLALQLGRYMAEVGYYEED